MGNGTGGRPLGTQTDETGTILAVEGMLSGDPSLSDRAAIIAVIGEDDSDVRRIQRKLKGWRERDPAVLLVGGVEHGEPRKGTGRFEWSVMVDVPTPGHDGAWGVAYAVHFATGPHLIVVRDEELVEAASHPPLPVFRAIAGLPRDYSWDDKGYRLVCSRLGLDPDLRRPPALASTEGLSFDRFGRGDQAERDRLMARVQVAFAFERDEHGYQPSRLATLWRDAHDGLVENVDQVKADVLRCLAGVDWDAQRAFTDLHQLATPFGFEHRASVGLHGSRRDGLGGCAHVAVPLVIAPPDEGDLLGRFAARLHERHCMAIVLSPDEREAYRADEAHWLGRHDWFRRNFSTGRPDLAMSRAVVDAMVRNAYLAYADRVAGTPFDPLGPLSHEGRPPIALSGDAPAVPAPARWLKDFAYRRRLATMGRRAPRDGMVRTSWGEVLVARTERGRVVVRPGPCPLSVDGARIAPSVTFHVVSRHLGRAVFDVTGADFSMVDERTGKAADVEVGLRVLGCLEGIAFPIMATMPRCEPEWSFVVRMRDVRRAVGRRSIVAGLGMVAAFGLAVARAHAWMG